MNKITILALGAVFAVSMIAITAYEVEAVKPQAQSIACPAANVQHWATFSWQASGTITHLTLPPVSGQLRLLEVQVSPDEVYKKEEVVLARLIELGYVDSTSQPLVQTDIQAVSVLGTSSTICAEN